MKQYSVPLLCCALLATGGLRNPANAQGSKVAAQLHIDKARAVSYEPGNDLTALFDVVCAPALSDRGPTARPAGAEPTGPRQIPQRSEWYSDPVRPGDTGSPPTKVFDNLYYVGNWRDSTWAVATSEGLILIDSGYDYSAKELIADGLTKLGLDPAQIKYVILSHAHNDRYFGAKFLQDTYKAHVIMSEADWNVVGKSTDDAQAKPKKDIVATDGMKLTLGDTTLTLYITPGHTPGTISTLVPLKDGTQRHVGAVWGGINPDMGRMGVQYFSSMPETFKIWSASASRFQEIAGRAGVDVYLTIHPFYDKALDKMHALKFRKPGGPHPFVNKDTLNHFLTIIKECTEAQLARIS